MIRSGCAGRHHTANLNNFLWATRDGAGPASASMCVRAHDARSGQPLLLRGDGRFHQYTIDWHTGGDGCEARVDIFVVRSQPMR